MPGPFPIGPVSHEFMRNMQRLGMKTGVDQWVPKFWQAMGKQQYPQAQKYLNTIRSVIKAQKSNTIAQELSAVVPEMEAALIEVGVTPEAAAAATGELASAVETVEGGILLAEAMPAIVIAGIIAALIYFSSQASAEEMPPACKNNPNVNPAEAVNREHLLKYFGQMRTIPRKAGG